jgi:signal transduction histidine kinase
MEYHMAHAPYGIVITDDEGRIVRANAPAGRILANPLLEGNRFEAVMNRVLAAPLAFAAIAIGNFAARLKTAESEEAHDWIELTVTPLKDSDSNRITGYYLMIKDLTGQISEERRLLAESRVRDLNQAGKVLNHDFANVLIGAEAQLRKLREGLVDAASFKAADGIGQALQHGRDILKHLGSGSQFGSPNLQTEAVHDLLRSAIDITRGAADEAKVALRLADEQGEPLFVEADRNQLVRVFTNLIRNALQASAADGRGEIAISAVRRGNGVQVRISDRGVGMSDAEIEIAFDPGFSSKGEGKGGLGLAISYLMVDAHGGRLDLERNAGRRGMSVVVWLPESRRGHEFAEYRGKKLIVASKRGEKIQQFIMDLERTQGCEVAEARDEDEVLALVREDAGWDLVLVDDSMPLDSISEMVGAQVQVKALAA